jgi:hypothetical protein
MSPGVAGPSGDYLMSLLNGLRRDIDALAKQQNQYVVDIDPAGQGRMASNG